MSTTTQLPGMVHGVDIDKEDKEVRARRKLRKSGGSTVVTIPPEMLDLLDFELGDNVELEAEIFGDEMRLRVVDCDDDNGGDSTGS